MDLYESMINLRKINIKDETIKLIEETKKELNNLIQIQTCKIYTGYLKDKCNKKGISSRIINTKDLGFSYEHESLLVNINEKETPYLLIDLTYGQFPLTYKRIFYERVKTNELETNGYMLANDEILKYYLMSISNATEINDINIDSIYFGKNK